MMIQPKSLSLSIGTTKVEFIVHRSIDLDDLADVAIEMTAFGKRESLQSIPQIISIKDLFRLGDYIERAVSETIDYKYVPMNLGFEFYVYDNDDYVSTVELFLLSSELDGRGRSYFGCRGPVLNETLASFAEQIKECTN